MSLQAPCRCTGFQLRQHPVTQGKSVSILMTFFALTHVHAIPHLPLKNFLCPRSTACRSTSVRQFAARFRDGCLRYVTTHMHQIRERALQGASVQLWTLQDSREGTSLDCPSVGQSRLQNTPRTDILTYDALSSSSPKSFTRFFDSFILLDLRHPYRPQIFDRNAYGKPSMIELRGTACH